MRKTFCRLLNLFLRLTERFLEERRWLTWLGRPLPQPLEPLQMGSYRRLSRVFTRQHLSCRVERYRLS